jgi:hypothetical protein
MHPCGLPLLRVSVGRCFLLRRSRLLARYLPRPMMRDEKSLRYPGAPQKRTTEPRRTRSLHGHDANSQEEVQNTSFSGTKLRRIYPLIRLPNSSNSPCSLPHLHVSVVRLCGALCLRCAFLASTAREKRDWNPATRSSLENCEPRRACPEPSEWARRRGRLHGLCSRHPNAIEKTQ